MATPLVNGIEYSYANITLILFGVPIAGVTNIQYKSSQEKFNNRAAGKYVVSRSYGAKDYEGSITLHMSEVRRIIAAAPNKDITDIAPFDITVAYEDLANGVLLTRDVIKSAEFTELPIDSSTGDDVISVELPLMIGKIEYSQ